MRKEKWKTKVKGRWGSKSSSSSSGMILSNQISTNKKVKGPPHLHSSSYWFRSSSSNPTFPPSRPSSICTRSKQVKTRFQKLSNYEMCHWNIIKNLILDYDESGSLELYRHQSIFLWVVGQPTLVIISSVHCPECSFSISLLLYKYSLTVYINISLLLYKYSLTVFVKNIDCFYITTIHHTLNRERLYYLYQFQLLIGILPMKSVWK